MLVLALALAASTELDRCLNSGEAAQGVSPTMAACFVADYRRADARLKDAYRDGGAAGAGPPRGVARVRARVDRSA